MQFDSNKEKKLVNSKLKGKQVLRLMYRFGQWNLSDWSFYKEIGAKMPKPLFLETERAEMDDVKKEYLQTVLHPGGVFSFMDQIGARGPLVVAGLAPLRDLDGHVPAPVPPSPVGHIDAGDASSAEEPLPEWMTVMFQVLSLKPSNKVLAYQMDLQKFLMPIQVQFFHVWRGSELRPDVPANQLDIFTDGLPEVVDAFSLGPWAKLGNEMKVWQGLTSSDMQGCYDISRPRLAMQRDGWTAACHDYPAMLMIRDLSNAGWQLDPERRSPHREVDIERSFVWRGICQRKSYLRCLLSLPSLFNDGLVLLALHQHELYYKACLLLADKAAIRPGLLVKDYKALLKAGGFDEDDDKAAPFPIELPDMPAALECELGMAGVEWGERIVPEAADDNLVLQGTDTPLAYPDGDPGGLGTPPADFGDLSGDDAAAWDPFGENDAEDGVHDVEVGAPAFKRLRDDLPVEIEGVKISEQVWNQEGIDGVHAPYQKFTVQCPLSHCMHLSDNPCSKSRNVTEAHTRHFGRVEVVGFLGKWIAMAGSFPSRALHMKYRPSVAEIEEYLQAQELL